NKTGFIKQLVTLEHALLIPARAFIKAEALTYAVTPPVDRSAIACLQPFIERWRDVLIDQRRPAIAKIFPRKMFIPAAPKRAGDVADIAAAGQREIADRKHAQAAVRILIVPAAIAEGVKLLGVAQLQLGLLLDPHAKPAFERAMQMRIEWAKWQTAAREI